MIFEIYIPSSTLGNYIENIIFYEGYSAKHLVDKLLPDGSISIIMDMRNKPSKLYYDMELATFAEFKGSFISGQHKNFMLIDADLSSMMVIRFKLGGACPFFNFPISKLNDTVLQLEPIFGNPIEEIRLKIINEKMVEKKFKLIEEFFLKRIKPEFEQSSVLSIAIKELLNNPYKATTKDLAQRAGISQKHLISLFDKKVGLTPKALARIFRFQKVILKIEEQQKLDWSEIVHECGYYDQAHFIKDFYEFSGIKPSGYPNQRGEFLNYLPIK